MRCMMADGLDCPHYYEKMQQVTSGDEAVYSSDGLSPLSIPNIPSGRMETSERDATNKVEGTDQYDISPSIDTRTAFEMFQGKLYKPLEDSEALKHLRRDSLNRESVLEKLTRLNAEIKELESDLSKIPSTSSSNVNKNKDTESMATSQIKDSVKDLSARLAALSGSVGNSSRSKLKLQKDLTSLIKNEVMKLSSAQNKSSSNPTTKVSSASTPVKAASHTASTVSSPTSQHQNTAQQTNGIVYELYAPIQGTMSGGDSSVADTSSPEDGKSMESLEKRLRRIENFVGQSNAVGSQELGVGTLLQRLVDLEHKIHRIDDKSLQLAATRAKVIRADLEAAVKARNKLNVNLSNAGEDPKVISRLYEQLLDLDGFFVSSPSNLLAGIVQRLSTCANLHSQAMTFENRLNELEKMAKEMSQLVQNVEECLSKVESGMVKNMKVMEQNMSTLDDRAKSLR